MCCMLYMRKIAAITHFNTICNFTDHTGGVLNLNTVLYQCDMYAGSFSYPIYPKESQYTLLISYCLDDR